MSPSMRHLKASRRVARFFDSPTARTSSRRWTWPEGGTRGGPMAPGGANKKQAQQLGREAFGIERQRLPNASTSKCPPCRYLPARRRSQSRVLSSRAADKCSAQTVRRITLVTSMRIAPRLPGACPSFAAHGICTCNELYDHLDIGERVKGVDARVVQTRRMSGSRKPEVLTEEEVVFAIVELAAELATVTSPCLSVLGWNSSRSRDAVRDPDAGDTGRSFPGKASRGLLEVLHLVSDVGGPAVVSNPPCRVHRCCHRMADAGQALAVDQIAWSCGLAGRSPSCAG